MNTFLKKHLILILNLLYHSVIFSQENYAFEQYHVEDGLPHNIINRIIQDKKGFIWIATTNGLSRYNGYSFANFKPKVSDKIIMKNNRIDKILEDTVGRIWITSEAIDSRVYCFDPRTESFWSPELITNLVNKKFNIGQIKITKSGNVWLLSKNDDGCILVSNSKYSTKVFHKKHNNLKNNKINNVFEDSKKQTWILTNNGITLINTFKPAQQSITFQKKNQKNFEFYSAIELEDEIYFGGSNGNLAIFSKENKKLKIKNIPLNANIIQLKKLDPQTILAITDQKGFCTINLITAVITKFDSNTLPQLKTNDLIPIAFTKQHQLWFNTAKEKGIYLFDFKLKKLFNFPGIKNDPVNTTTPLNAFVITDKKGTIWVQPYGGVFSKFNNAQKKLIPFKLPNSSISNGLHTAFFDRQGSLWYNIEATGLSKITFSDYNFINSPLQNPPRNVRSLFQDKKQNIWVGTKQKQIILFDKNLNQLGMIAPTGMLNQSASWSKTAYSIIEDKDQTVWIGTRGDGLYKLTPLKEAYHYKVEHYLNNNKNNYSLSSNDIYSVYEDHNGLIWIGTFNGLNLIEEDKFGKLRFINHKNRWTNYPLDSFNKIRCIKETKEGVILVGSTGGLVAIKSSKNRFHNLGNLKSYNISSHKPNGLMSNDIMDICITQKGLTILATADGGISKVISKNHQGFPLQFKTFGRNEGLPSANMLSIVEDNNHKIWTATDDILTRFDYKKEYFEVFPELKWILSNTNFSEATKIKLQSGELLFGYTEGIVRFFPNQIKTNDYAPYLAFTNLRLFNKKVEINSNNSPLILSLDNNKKIVLKHNQNFFNIEYAALDYKNPKNIKYAYKLEGFDEKWNFVNNQRTAFYTNVPKGSYTFKVKSTNSQGNWVANERSLRIKVEPSIWNTTLAYIIYALLIIGCILLINRTMITIYQLKTNAKIEKDMFDMKQKFFIDISHELRTPLTLISGPIEYLINDNRTPEIIKKQLSYVSQSTSRLQRLVNQILDFRKIQDQKLKISEINLTEFASDIFNNFIEIAQEKKINYNLEILDDDIKLWADKNALEKIIMNLLSNAFKYTPDEKAIRLRIYKTEKKIGLTVIDEGIGISEEHHNSIFNRFSSFNKNSNNTSTGIGLSMVKELVEKHHGEINFESKTNKGSSFSVFFKQGYSHFTDEVEISTEEESKDTIENKLIKTQPITLYNNPEDSQEKIKILVVEDDLKLRTFLKNVLEDDYEILEAEDGEIAYQKILEATPDFIISDIMMPKLNGVELLQKIRNNIETSHVPVILLTAKTTIESQLEGLSYGADDYITKPFSVSYLKARIVNLLEQRKRLQGIFDSYEKSDPKEYNPKPYLITDQDEQIMQKVMLAIEENIDNNDFSVEDLGSVVGLNRTSFYYKIKSLTGYTPVEFIRDVRIKRAAQLLMNSQLLIKEIAYMTGFSDMKYFTKSFKNKYDVTPSEYRKENK
ncbi:hybrid sensor histidine kinase/response regulator transcription factor [Flavobacterium flavipallidum]|uniref:histidine kinase n=1 Tax=Flavobacterium flavipallidum TaxID=3139140 RepID=A0ABU9HR61_9FLAO